MTSYDLSSGKCVPCKAGTAPLSHAEVQKLLQQTTGWQLTQDGKAISRRYSFKNFKQSLAFVNALGSIAEAEGHHPDITFGWGYAEILYSTHDIGGLHPNDFIMAQKTNAIK